MNKILFRLVALKASILAILGITSYCLGVGMELLGVLGVALFVFLVMAMFILLWGMVLYIILRFINRG